MHWILGGGIKNIFHTLTMVVEMERNDFLKGTLKPKEMQKVASYVTLKGSNPVDPKSPDGEIWVEEAAVVSTTK
jgi:cytochrome c oxidase cbb3-type subunit 3